MQNHQTRSIDRIEKKDLQRIIHPKREGHKANPAPEHKTDTPENNPEEGDPGGDSTNPAVPGKGKGKGKSKDRSGKPRAQSPKATRNAPCFFHHCSDRGCRFEKDCNFSHEPQPKEVIEKLQPPGKGGSPSAVPAEQDRGRTSTRGRSPSGRKSSSGSNRSNMSGRSNGDSSRRSRKPKAPFKYCYSYVDGKCDDPNCGFPHLTTEEIYAKLESKDGK